MLTFRQLLRWLLIDLSCLQLNIPFATPHPSCFAEGSVTSTLHWSNRCLQCVSFSHLTAKVSPKWSFFNQTVQKKASTSFLLLIFIAFFSNFPDIPAWNLPLHHLFPSADRCHRTVPGSRGHGVESARHGDAMAEPIVAQLRIRAEVAEVLREEIRSWWLGQLGWWKTPIVWFTLW